MPLAAEHYRRSGPTGGGAELQTVLLARTLAARGMRIAHIVWPIDDPLPPQPGLPTVVQRAPFRGSLRAVGGATEAVSIWRSLRVADASSYLFRTGGSPSHRRDLFCQVHRRESSSTPALTTLTSPSMELQGPTAPLFVPPSGALTRSSLKLGSNSHSRRRRWERTTSSRRSPALSNQCRPPSKSLRRSSGSAGLRRISSPSST